MIDLDRVSRNQKYASRAILLSGVITPILGTFVFWSRNLDDDTSEIIFWLATQINNYLPWIYLILLLTFLAGKFGARHGSRVIWEALQRQIDSLQKEAFPLHVNAVNDLHRVTLFKKKKRCFSKRAAKFWMHKGKSEWLVPVLRSGHTSKGTKAKFRAPDNGKDAEGIVGLCWSSDSMQYRERLPNINKQSSEANKERYCQASNMPREMLNGYCIDGKDLARCILAFPIITKNANRWGVLVFDSMDPVGVDRQRVEQAFRVLAETLGVLVEEV